jgi:hypothetical protein
MEIVMGFLPVGIGQGVRAFVAVGAVLAVPEKVAQGIIPPNVLMGGGVA